MNTAAQEPTPEQLALALRQLWRPGWPADVAAALAHPNPVYSTCVRGLARNLRRAPMKAVSVPRLGLVHQAPATPTEPPRAQAKRALVATPRGL